jgi:hypothetical protein
MEGAVKKPEKSGKTSPMTTLALLLRHGCIDFKSSVVRSYFLEKQPLNYAKWL